MEKTWKKTLCGILTAAMVLGLGACGGEKPEETSIPTETSMATQPTKPAKKPTPKPGKKPDNKKPDASKPTETTAATEPDHGSSGNGGSSSGGSSSDSSSSNSGYSGGGSSGGSSYEEPKPQPTEAPAPKPTDPPATQPPETEPPVTEHVHTWHHDHTDEVGHWDEKFICQECGWSCTESQAAAAGYNILQYYAIFHQDVVEGGLLYHSYDADADWIVDEPAWDQWTCTGCGEVTNSDPT